MIDDLCNMKIERVILHQVFDNGDDGKVIPPKISTSFTKLDTQGLSTLQSRIINVIGVDTHSIEMVITDDSNNSAYAFCKNMITSSDEEKIKISGNFAQKLARSQMGKNTPGGILVVLSGTIGNNNDQFVGIIKAELHDGFTIDEKDQSLFLQLLTSLLLTPQQKLYKIGIFINKKQAKDVEMIHADDFIVYVYDHLMAKKESSSLARYFFDTFLGCDYSQNDKKLTQDFFLRTKDFINQLNLPKEEVIDIRSLLYALLRNENTNTIQVADTAETIFPSSVQEEYGWCNIFSVKL